jgi:hypothetical protein
MDKEKSLLETLADTVLAAAESIVHPTEGTPMEMPLNESGYAITHLQAELKPAAKRAAKKKKVARKPAKRAAAKKSKSAAGRKAKKAAAKPAEKKAVTKVAKKKKAGKARR